MTTQRFKKRKKPNYKRAIILLILLIVIAYVWLHTEEILNRFLEK